MEIRHNMKSGLGVFLLVLTLLVPEAGKAEDRVGVFQRACWPYTIRITFSSSHSTLKVDVFGPGPGVKRSWVVRRQVEDTMFPAIARYCPEQGNCIDGQGSVKFTQFGKKRAAGSYSLKLSTGATEQGSFRVKSAGEVHLICE
jgi:hypothetical protein